MTKILKIIISVPLMALVFISCSTKDIPQTQNIKLPNQNIATYEHNFQTLPKKIKQNLYSEHFKVWEQNKISFSQDQAKWGFIFASRYTYGANYKLLSKEWYDENIANANFEDFSTKNKKAIIIKNSNLRIFPTSQPIYYDPKQAGEGFPFDYNQNSAIYINTPIIVSHFTKDKAWVYVQSSFASGFVKISDIAFVDKKIENAFKQSNYFVAIKDNFTIHKLGQFKEKIKLGTIFPKSKYGNFFVVNQFNNLQGYLQTVSVPTDALVENSLQITPQNIKQVINELQNEPYGWGGLYSFRDCSSMTRDYFSTFGIFLNRNSKQQALQYNYISFKDLSIDKKEEFIVQQGKPFFTLVYLQGHIMLYIGVDNANKPLFFHNTWGIELINKKNKKEKYIIGKAIISTLNLGEELKGFNKDKLLLNRVEGISIIE